MSGKHKRFIFPTSRVNKTVEKRHFAKSHLCQISLRLKKKKKRGFQNSKFNQKFKFVSIWTEFVSTFIWDLLRKLRVNSCAFQDMEFYFVLLPMHWESHPLSSCPLVAIHTIAFRGTYASKAPGWPGLWTFGNLHPSPAQKDSGSDVQFHLQFSHLHKDPGLKGPPPSNTKNTCTKTCTSDSLRSTLLFILHGLSAGPKQV